MEAAIFAHQELPGLARFFEVRKEGAPLREITFVADAPKFTLSLEGSLNFLTARLQAGYTRRVVTLGQTDPGEQFSAPDPLQGGRFLTRNPKAETDALARLSNVGFTISREPAGEFVLKGEQRVLRFLAVDLPQMEKIWETSLGTRFTQITRQVERITPNIEFTSSGENWFELNINLAAEGGQSFSSGEIQRLLQMGQGHVRLRNGKIGIFDSGMLDELNSALSDCSPRQARPGTYRMDMAHASYLDSIFSDAAVEVSGRPPSWSSAGRQLDAMEPIPLGSLEEVLRPYQKLGVYWMNFLAANGFGGILADEMGLGKTLQALAFLRSTTGSALIVCPSSLIGNWRREAERFCPELSVVVLEGAGRHALFDKARDSRLVITSYPLLRRDVERYRSMEFSAIILDESQHIKNPDTQNAQAAGSLVARNRFVLTGTPMENSVRDLWSVMNFLMPGYLGSRADFKEKFEIPLQQEATSAPLRARLVKRLRPFMLRRLKKDVAADLPEKLEQISYCELTADQASVYQELLRQSRARMEEASCEQNQGRARIIALTALLRLRQACCDLRLLKLDGVDPATSSAKLELLDELLQESIDGGHRVLIFSQFVSMLHLIKERLASAGTSFCYLDGATKDRLSVVDKFQTDSSVPVFLISLKAGGVGLNLTGADTVIHFDPWWNPAVEAQATDRAHRIGQTNVVTSYKLISRGTVEEKILNLQQKKRDLIDAMVESDEPMMGGLSMGEIQTLLS